MGSKERQERERQAVRESILNAARDLFTTEGYRHVSMRKIADRIEYSPAAIYSYFRSKDDIFFALAEEGFNLLAQHARHAISELTDPQDRLRQGLWAFYEFSKAHPEYFELMFLDRSVPSLSQDFHQYESVQEMLTLAETDIRECVERGLFSDGLDPAAGLHVLWAGMLGVAAINLARRLHPGEDADALAHDTLTSLLAGFTTTVHTTFVPSECAMPSSAEPAAGEDDFLEGSHNAS